VLCLYPFYIAGYLIVVVTLEGEEPTENATVWQRLEQGRKAKALNGGYAGYGSPAFGQISAQGTLVADPHESQIIELIRRHHKSGKSLQDIANWLNNYGYTTKRGRQWQRISVKRVLDRLYGKTPKISGRSTLNKQCSDAAALVTSEIPENAIESQNIVKLSISSLLA
jgi:Recombinase